MFIFSLKSFKGKLFLLTVAVIAIAIVCAVVINNEPISQPDSPADSAINYSASSQEEIESFIKQTGYTVISEPISVTEIIIPYEFDSVYNQYNEIQKKSGFDLNLYKNCTVKKWTYQVTNYPEYKNSDAIRLTVLVYKDKIIGGDICSIELDGFMHGLFTK